MGLRHVTRNGHQIKQEVTIDCQSTIADLPAANKTTIDALQVKFLRKMTDQIKEVLMDEKR